MDSIKRVHSQWEQYEAKVLSTFNSHISRSEISDEDLAELLRIREDSIRTWQLKGFTVYNADESIVSDDDLINNTYWLYYEHARELAVVVERRESLIIGVKNSMKTTWNQTASYNVSFPILSNGNHAYAGCTTIAAGQVMYYYKHPIIAKTKRTTFKNETSKSSLFSLPFFLWFFRSLKHQLNAD